MITIRFSNTELQVKRILVSYNSSLQDENNLNENFHISSPIGLDTYLERKMFYFFDNKKWTLNELTFFARNNNLCLTLLRGSLIVKKYGKCAKELIAGLEINAKILSINE